MEHTITVLRDELHVDGIFTLYYFEFGVKYLFPGERHDFWEMIYVDAGELTVNTEEGFTLLRRGDAIFHPPGFFHACRGSEREPVNIIVLTFALSGSSLDTLKNRVVHLNERHAGALAAIIREAKSAFSTRLDSYIGQALIRNPLSAFGSEQLIRLHLEGLLIDLLREHSALPENHPAPPKTAARAASDTESVERIIDFLKNNLYRRITIRDISDYAALSPTRVKTLFRDTTGVPLITYANQLKIGEAKRLLRTGWYTVGEVAELLSYSSIQYFSHSFRKETGLTPTAYAASVKAKTPVE